MILIVLFKVMLKFQEIQIVLINLFIILNTFQKAKKKKKKKKKKKR